MTDPQAPSPDPSASAGGSDPDTVEVGPPPVSVPVAGADAPSRRSALLRTGVILGVLFVVFFIILPRYVDYADVLKAFQALEPWQILVMTVLGFLAWIVSGMVFSALIPGLSVSRGTQSWLILSGIGSSIPLGPWNMGVLWVVERGWGIPNRAATSGIALYGIVNEISRLFLPLAAVILLVATGQMPSGSSNQFVWFVAIVGIIAFFLGIGLIVAIVRSERLAEWIGTRAQRLVGWALKRAGRSGAPDVHGSTLRFREQLGEIIRTRGLLSLLVSISSYLVWAVVFIAAQRACGVPESALTNAEIFAVYAIVMVITILPISPGGAGVPELLYISGLTTIAGEEWNAAITAGVFLFRAYQWFLPIPLAWILLKVARRGKPMLPTGAELKAAAADQAV